MKSKWFDPGTAVELAEATLDAYLDEVFPDKDQNQLITNFLNKNFKQPHVNKNIWTSYLDEDSPSGNGWANLNVTHANKDQCAIKVYYFGQDLPEGQKGKKSSNLKVELYLISFYEWETFFEGHVPNLETLKIIFNSLGIKYTE